MTIELTDNEFNLLMNLLDAHVENLQEWVVTEEDQDMVQERDDYQNLFNKLVDLENKDITRKGVKQGGVSDKQLQEMQDDIDYRAETNYNPYSNPDGI